MKKILKGMLPLFINVVAQTAKDAIDSAAVNRKYAYLHDLKPIINELVRVYKAKLPAISVLKPSIVQISLLKFVLGLLKDIINTKDNGEDNKGKAKLSMVITAIEAYLTLKEV